MTDQAQAAPRAINVKRARELVQEAILDSPSDILDGITGRAVKQITSAIVTALVAEGVVDDSVDQDIEDFLDQLQPGALRDDVRKSIAESGGLDIWVAEAIKAIGEVNNTGS